jgi:hypothetical protein
MPHVDDHIKQTAFALWLERHHKESWDPRCYGRSSFDDDQAKDLGASVAMPYLKVIREYTAGRSTNLVPERPLTREEARQDVRMNSYGQLARFFHRLPDGSLVPAFPDELKEHARLNVLKEIRDKHRAVPSPAGGGGGGGAAEP